VDSAAVGIELTEGALDALPAEDLELLLPFPAGFTGFKNAVLNWNHEGHEPKEIYGRPHFDFHFYLISEDERMAISCQGDDTAVCMKRPEDRYLPPQYAPGPEGVPMMGWHWVDVLSPEFHGQPFTSTFIFGYYAGLPIFIEPMITRAFLLERTRFEAPIRLPEAFRDGTFPSAYSVAFDGAAKVYRITLKY
jgi:hypothetical protein